jgi:hypothetical protein
VAATGLAPGKTMLPAGTAIMTFPIAAVTAPYPLRRGGLAIIYHATRNVLKKQAQPNSCQITLDMENSRATGKK